MPWKRLRMIKPFNVHEKSSMGVGFFSKGGKEFLVVKPEVGAVTFVRLHRGSIFWSRRLNVLQNMIWVLHNPSLKIQVPWTTYKSILEPHKTLNCVLGVVFIVEGMKWVSMWFKRPEFSNRVYQVQKYHPVKTLAFLTNIKYFLCLTLVPIGWIFIQV